MKPGFYRDVSMTDYRNGPGISRSDLALVARSPKHFHERSKEKKSVAKELGTRVHTAFLEPHIWERDWLTCDFGRNSNAFKDMDKAVTAKGKHLITNAEREEAESIAQALRDDDFAMRILTNGERELTAYWVDEETGVLCKCRTDVLDRDDPSEWIIVDPKTAASANPEDFPRHAVKFGYHVQAAFYQDGVREAARQSGADLPERITMCFVAIESDPPHGIALYEFTPGMVEKGRDKYKRALHIYAQCKAAGDWPGYPRVLNRIDTDYYKRGD